MTLDQHPAVRVFSEEPLYSDSMFALTRVSLRHRLYSGGESATLNRLVFERGESSAILLYHPLSDCVVLTEQFRVGAYRDTSPWCREIVAGVVEPGDTPEETALRESFEEVGITPYQLTPIMALHPSPGACTEKIHIYLGLIDQLPEQQARGVAGEGEDILSLAIPLEEAVAEMTAGKMDGASTIIALQWLCLHKDTI